MLEAVSRKLCDELRHKGINALMAYPDADMDRQKGVVAVSIKKAQVKSGGFGDYLGYGDTGEVYGLVCEAKFALDIYSEPEGGYAALSKECDSLISAVWEISGGIGELTLGECSYDKTLCALRCPGALDAKFWLTRNGDESGEIEEFTVKGMILHGNE